MGRKPLQDIKNKTFGRLKALYPCGSTGNGAIWRCKCDCGANPAIHRTNLISGSTKSGGCIPNRSIEPNQYHCKNKVMTMYVQRCRKNGRKFELNLKQMVELAEKECYYCGLLSSNVSKTTRDSWNYNGLDRVDNSGDYTLNNVVPCCKYCNSLKMDILSLEETKKVVDFIKKLRNTQISPWN